MFKLALMDLNQFCALNLATLDACPYFCVVSCDNLLTHYVGSVKIIHDICLHRKRVLLAGKTHPLKVV